MKNGAPQISADDILASVSEAVFAVDGGLAHHLV